MSLFPVASSLLAITGRLLTIHRGPCARNGRRITVIRSSSAIRLSPHGDVLTGKTATLRTPIGVLARRSLPVTQRSGLISRHSDSIPNPCRIITGSGRLGTTDRAAPAFCGAAPAKLTSEIVQLRIPTVHEIAIASSLVSL